MGPRTVPCGNPPICVTYTTSPKVYNVSLTTSASLEMNDAKGSRFSIVNIRNKQIVP